MRGLGTIWGNSSSISAPAGWTKIAGDLNAGAGGLYIYFIHCKMGLICFF